jgi:hypothetical protein
VLEEEFLKAFKNFFFPIRILDEDNSPKNWVKILLSFDLNGRWLIEYLLAGSTDYQKQLRGYWANTILYIVAEIFR